MTHRMQDTATASECKGCARCAALTQERDRLLAQIEAAKLKLFWGKHNREQLKRAMQRANQDAAKGPNCACVACGTSGRMHHEQRARGNHCSFKRYFEAMLAECGLTREKCQGKRVGEVGAHDAAEWIFANDAHLVLVMDDDWRAFTYGGKLWRATSCDDPELAKLALLFRRLSRAEAVDV
jgi:hypothetical protein